MVVTRNDARHRFETTVDGHTSVLTYRESDGRVTLIHTEVPFELRGRGIADALARVALDDVRQRGLRVLPLCPFVQVFMKRHPEYADLADPAVPPGGSR
jgi:predicted GNAT family acetyltransferase